ITAFNASHRSIKDAIKRAAELDDALTSPHLADIERARWALEVAWSFLATETDMSDGVRRAAEELEDLLGRETFFRDFPTIDQHAAAIAAEYKQRQAIAVSARAAAYEHALDELRGT